MSTLDGPIWGRCNIALTCLTRSNFQRTQNRERWGQGWNERYGSSREEEEYGDEDGQEKGRTKGKEKTGDRFLGNCTNQQPPQRGGAVPDPVWVGSKWLLGFPRVPVTPGTPLQKPVRSACLPLT